ncbi:alpha-mannosidase [Paenibacillus sp. N1-5-1-14]|uniref:alpha-mannosidase n=1 Tax=Paenibacillus radicibacter TaxID=2972488 RepID=UPI002158A48B|nr:alpha-mannosidase [Paenibacillus radicibacter]MCR8642525.1 alpha-mannosidase [Paenibacillus radicibacter]
MAKKTAHIISHTHWDREWYLPYEHHHLLLIETMDTLLDTLEKDPNYRYFHLDGQTIMIDDYLQVRPEKKEQLTKFIKEGRILIGPWYILQDEFLTSSEANIRNMQIGHRDAKEYGVISKLGYFPDSFGNMGQAPQILKQADIDAAVFGRGVKPTGFNNTVGESDTYESPYSEMIWESPDGSSVIGILFANWYCNGMEIPTDPEKATEYWNNKLADALKFASTDHLLFMNGCDHQPIQTDLSEAIQTAQALHPEIEFIHSNFDDYVDVLKNNLSDDMVTIQGELRSQHTDGWGTLVNTASSRVYLKQMNQRCQTLLEKVAEPLAAFAHISGDKPYPHHLFNYSWKTLMQNHPHDSICGCSVDEVHREMVTRFEKSRHMTEQIVEQSLEAIVKQIHTDVPTWGQEALPFTVFNSTGWDRSGVVSVELIVAQQYFQVGITPAEQSEQLSKQSIDHYVLHNEHGEVIPTQVDDLGVIFGYDLPKDKFRQPYMARRVRLTFLSKKVPALGYQTYAWVPNQQAGIASKQLQTEKPASLEGIVYSNERSMENELVSVSINNDGTLQLTDKRTGRTFDNLCSYENTGDIGNEYVFRQPEGEQTLTTQGLPASHIRLIENTPHRATIEVVHEWAIPASADELFEEEKRKFVLFTERKAKRVEETVPFVITTQYTLEAMAPNVQVRTTFNNVAKDHRLRALFPTGINTTTAEVDSIFEVASRDIVPAKEWVNPSNCQHQHAFVSVHDAEVGLTVANRGLNEYEVLRDGQNTIAITLLRAVSELGDWGVFPTPEAQCLGEQVVEFSIFPHAGDGIQSGAYSAAYQYQIPWTVKQTKVQQGSLPLTHQWLKWKGTSLAFSSVKISEETGDLASRWYNLADNQESLDVQTGFDCTHIHASDILERRNQMLGSKDLNYYPVSKKQIVTLSFDINK